MDRQLSILEHISELRKRILISLIVLGVATLASFSFSSRLLVILKQPASGLIENLVFFSPQEAFLIYMRIATLCGFIISLPVISYQFWVFVNPAIEERFKRHILLFILFCTLSFIGGCVFSFFFIVPPALKFLLGFAGKELVPVISGEKYISFVTGVIFGTGLVFQMPVLSLILTRLGIINALLLRRKYKYALVAIFIIAAIITPTTDVFNMLILAGPMLCLYEISIWVSFLARPKKELAI